MTLKELYQVAPTAFIFVRGAKGVEEYKGGAGGDRIVKKVTPTEYPMFKQVLEVELEKAEEPEPARPFTVADLLSLEDDIDVYDDVCEEVAICFCGPQALTEAGREHFAEALALEIEVNDDSGYAIVHVDDPDERVWKRKLRAAKEFFYACAGYCDADLYDKWFEEA